MIPYSGSLAILLNVSFFFFGKIIMVLMPHKIVILKNRIVEELGAQMLNKK